MSISESVSDYLEEQERRDNEILLLMNLKKEIEQEMSHHVDVEVQSIKGIEGRIEECISEFMNVRSLLEEYCEGKVGEVAREVAFRRKRQAEQSNECVNDAVRSCKVSGTWFW
ncbi:hypothetical protein ROU88_09675 [Macrococcus capreoli]